MDEVDRAQKPEAEFVEEAIARVKARRRREASLTHCEECGEKIPEKRRQAVEGVSLCIECATEQEKFAAVRFRRQ